MIFHISESRGMNRYVVTTANYLVASLVSGAFMLFGKLPESSFAGAARAFLNEFSNVIKGSTFSPAGSLGWAVIVGISAGILYYLGFIYLQKAVKESGVSLAGSFSRMGILVPMVLSVLLFRELPSSLQWVGICLALFSILLANIDLSRPAGFLSGFQPVLIMLFMIVGLAEFSNKVFQKYGVLEAKSLFLFFVFTTALLISIWKTIRKGERPKFSNIITGFVVGVPNFFASFFLILALSRLQTAVVFPLYSALTIVLISLSGWILFGEKLKKRERFAVTLTVAALVLVNLQS